MPAQCTLPERFLRQTGPPDAHGCRLWEGSLTVNGYGQININRRTRRAHQVAWELATGEPILPGQIVLHTCDNRRCVQTDGVGTYEVGGDRLPRRGHLALGTKWHNTRDMYAKGRADRTHRSRGNDHYEATLTEALVVGLRRQWQHKPFNIALVARGLGIGETTLRKALHGTTWKHVAQT